MSWAASRRTGGCTPLLTNVPTLVAVVLVSLLVIGVVLG